MIYNKGNRKEGQRRMNTETKKELTKLQVRQEELRNILNDPKRLTITSVSGKELIDLQNEFQANQKRITEIHSMP
jgi:hypothetical protein